MFIFGVAAGPFYCAQGLLPTALGACMLTPYLISVDALVSETKAMALERKIDDSSHLESTRVYLFSGTKDTVVVQGKLRNAGEARHARIMRYT